MESCNEIQSINITGILTATISLTIHSVSLDCFTNADKLTESENQHEGKDDHHRFLIKVITGIERHPWYTQIGH